MQNSGIVKAKEKKTNMTTVSRLIHAAGSDQTQNKHRIPTEEINAWHSHIQHKIQKQTVAKKNKMTSQNHIYMSTPNTILSCLEKHGHTYWEED